MTHRRNLSAMKRMSFQRRKHECSPRQRYRFRRLGCDARVVQTAPARIARLLLAPSYYPASGAATGGNKPMNYTITPLTPHTGAEVRGIDLNQAVDGETRAALNRALADHHVLVIRDQKFEPADFMPPRRSLASCFSTTRARCTSPAYPQMYYVSNQDGAGQARYLGRDLPHRPLEPSGAAQGDDPLSRCRCRAKAATRNTSTCTSPMTSCPTRRSSGSTG